MSTSNDVSTFADDDAFRVIEGASYVVNYFGFNQQVPLWQDLRVRQAFMHAIDRNAIIASLYGGAAMPANCVYIAEALVPAGIDDYAYDPEKAKALLEEAGWAEINGDKPIEAPDLLRHAAGRQRARRRAGDARPGRHQHRAARRRHADLQQHRLHRTTDDQFPMVYAGLQNGPDASNINIGLNEKQIPPAGANIMRIRMPEVTAALDAALAETDDATRDARYQDVCKATNANLPWATMWVANRYGVASSS